KTCRRGRRFANPCRFAFVRRFTAERAHHLRSAGQDPEVEISALETRQDVVVDYRAADRVGELSFEAVTDFDANFVLVGRHDKQRSVILSFLAYAPVAAKLIAEFLDGISLQ